MERARSIEDRPARPRLSLEDQLEVRRRRAVAELVGRDLVLVVATAELLAGDPRLGASVLREERFVGAASVTHASAPEVAERNIATGIRLRLFMG